LPAYRFANPEELEGGHLVTFQPKEGDRADYVAIKGKDGKLFAITTSAANALGLIKAIKDQPRLLFLY
jgi:N-methylhydantoinase A